MNLLLMKYCYIIPKYCQFMKEQITKIARKEHSLIQVITEHTSNDSLSTHKHEDFELMLITQGKELLYINGAVIEVSAGDILFLGGGIVHQKMRTMKSTEQSTWHLLFFPKSIFPSMMNHIPDYIYITSLLEQSRYGLCFRGDDYYRIISNAIGLINQSVGVKRISLLFDLLEWMSLCKYELLSNTRSVASFSYQEGTDPVLKVMNYLEKHYSDVINLQFLSDLVGMSKFSLCRSFKLKTGLTIQQYLQNLRIEEACRLIVSRKFTIAEIASKVGYQNTSVFNQHFKRIVNKTPSQFKRIL